MSERKLISSGSSFEKVAGFSRAVVDGDWMFVSGTTGYDYTTMTISPDLEAQTRQTFANISSALAQAGCTLDDVVRVHYYLADQAYFKQVAPIFGEYFKNARPAATALVCGLVTPEMKIEIEVTARRRGAAVGARGAQDAYPPGELKALNAPLVRSSEIDAMPGSIEFYFDFSSPYGYFAATRISALAAQHGRSVHVAADAAGCGVQGDGQRAVAEPAAQGRLRAARHAAHARASTVSLSRCPTPFPIPTQAPGACRLLAEGAGAGEGRGRRAGAVPRLLRGRQGHLQSGDHGRSAEPTLGVDAPQVLAALNDPAIKERLKARPTRPSTAAYSARPMSLWTANRSGAMIGSTRSSAGSSQGGF